MGLYLERPLLLLVIPLGLAGVWFLLRRRNRIGFSKISLYDGIRGIPFLFLQKAVLSAAVILLGIALAQPAQYSVTAVPIYAEARDIVVTLDISGSMVEPRGTNNGGIVTKLGHAKDVIREFFESRPQDRIFLVAFDDQGYLEWVKVTDPVPFLARLEMSRGGGGTQVGRGLIVSLDLLERYGNDKGGAVIVVSDGITSVKPAEAETINRLLVQTHPRIYWILIGDQNQPMAQNFRNYIEGLGGKFYQTRPQDLRRVFAEISELESSPVVYEQRVTAQVRFGPILAILAGVLLIAALLEIIKEV